VAPSFAWIEKMDTPTKKDAAQGPPALAAIAKTRKNISKEVTGPAFKDGYPLISYPVNSRMIELRLLAENLHRQWLARKFDLVRSELRTASRRDLAVLASLMTDLTPQLRRLEFALWLAEDTLIENDFDAAKSHPIRP
jgi:hypothetical protein